MKTRTTLLALTLFAAASAAFAETATVEAVQYPAWLERGGNAVPLTPGTVLQGQDRLRTGGNARVQLRLGEGSTVKLGENAQFAIEKVEDRGIFRAALNVLTGAFRFTTDELARRRGRDVTIRVAHVTAGIRGTDLWGKSTGERDLVCLLEGKISVGSEGHPNVTLDQPGAFYQKPRDGDPSVASVDQKQIDTWAKETEVSPDGPAARRGGKWQVTAAKFRSRNDALALSRSMRANGYPAEVRNADMAYAVVVAGLAGEPEARALMSNLREFPGVLGPTVQGP